jgi:transcriptional regulator with XRE-family HTH domain
MSALAELKAPMEQDREFGREALLRRLGQLAKQRREELGLGRVTFAKEAGLGSDKTLQDFEFGRRLAHGTSMRKIERALGWRLGVTDDILRDVNRKAASISMEDLDEFDSQPGGTLAQITTQELLAELIKRLSTLQQVVGKPAGQELYGLAASHNMEHLEDEDEDENA